MSAADDSKWPRARLIPVSGISSTKEAETRAASAVLAVLSVVRDLSNALFGPMGAPRAQRATVETFTEPIFAVDGKRIRPDGVVRITYGKASWTALVEVKTGGECLQAEQINTYWEIARQHGFDAIVTISNELATSSGTHPTLGLRVRANSRVAVHHISWTELLSAAVMCKVHRGVSDPEQAYLADELIRYLEHPASGAMAFDDMGANWVAVRDGARDGSLRKNDPIVAEVAARWDQLVRYAALQLGQQIGQDVQPVLPRAHQEPKARSTHLIDAICTSRPLDGVLRIPHTVGDLEIAVDLKARRLYASVIVPAPDDRGGRARSTWITSQLRDAPADLVIEAYAKNARTAATASLAQAAENRDLLLGADKRDPVRFRIVMTREMGMNRKTGDRKSGFIDSVIGLVRDFYGSVVQNVVPWAPKAPRITVPATIPASDDEGQSRQEAIEPDDPMPEVVSPIPTSPEPWASPWSGTHEGASE